MDCLVTKLKGVVNDTSLKAIGEFRIRVNRTSSPTSKTQGFTFNFNKDVPIKIIGDGYFTDKALTANNGKTMNITANTTTNVYVSNGDFEIAVTDKYSLVEFMFYPTDESNITASEMKNRYLNLDDLKFATSLNRIVLSNTQVSGDISSLSGLHSLTEIRLSNTQVSGDISALSNLTSLRYIDMSNTQVSGDISALSGLTALTNISLPNTQVSGDISSLSGLILLNTISLTNTQVSGDISALSKLTALNKIVLYNVQGNLSSLNNLTKLEYLSLRNSKITGDLATIASTCYFVSLLENNETSLTWSSRPSTANIIAIEGSPQIDNVDKMLQDQAQCVEAIPSSGQTWFKTISATGSRTSVSDSAVSTLQEKGYTVSIKNE